MWRPRRAGLGVLPPRRSPNLGKVRRRSCLRLISLPGTSDVLLAPIMISHPLAYVAPNPRQISFMLTFIACYLVVFIFSDYKYSYLSPILHLYHHLFAELVHLH